jgi:hypothetical protein
VVAWLNGRSVAEVARHLKMPPKAVLARGSYYQKRGVPLPKLPYRALEEVALEAVRQAKVSSFEKWWTGEGTGCKDSARAGWLACLDDIGRRPGRPKGKSPRAGLGTGKD